MPFSGWINDFKAKSAIESPWIDPWGWAWRETKQWDMTNANWATLEEGEPDNDRFWQAADLSDESEHEAANAIWRDLAGRDSVKSMAELGLSYEFGRGMLIDLDQAESWYERARQGGSTYAMLKCAEFALNRQEFSKCSEILRPGVELGLASPQFWQAFGEYKACKNKETFHRIFRLLKSAAAQGHPGAKAYLTNFMVRGKFGVVWIPIGLVRALQLAITKTNHYRPEEAAAV